MLQETVIVVWSNVRTHCKKRSFDTWTDTSEESRAKQIFVSVCNVYL